MSLDAKIVLLGAQGVGKTSFVVRYVKNTFQEGNASTIGASFQAKKVVCDDCVIRLQIWDTAGQERFRSMAPIYYRSASCGILCYDITSEASFKAMHSWLNELKQNLDNSIIIHIVGTKLDLVSADPSRRQVPFESCLQYARAQLGPDDSVDACHEISAKDDEGVEEVFQAITRKIITRRRSIQNRYNEQEDRRQTIYLHKEDDEVVQRGCC